MDLRKTLPVALFAALTALPTQAAPPKPDFANLPAYIQALDASTDPQAAAIRKEIADGPAALAYERAAARAAGIPLDLAQLQRPLPPPGQNAAPLFQQLDALRKAKPLNLPLYAQPLDFTREYTPAQIAAAQKIVDSRRDVFDLLHQAADRPQCVFTRTWSLGPALLFPDYAGLREDARELNTESFLLANQGHYAEAIADQSRGFQVAQDAASDPILIAWLVGIAINAITNAGMDNILYQAGPNAAVDTMVQQTVTEDWPALSLKSALSGEVAMTLWDMDSLRKDPAALPLAFVPRSANPQLLTQDQTQFALDVIDAAEAQYLHTMRNLIAVADQPGPARQAIFASLSAPLLNTDGSEAQSLDPATALNQKITFSGFQSVASKDDQLHAMEQVTLAAAAVLAVKARTGAFPDALPGNFTDPFSAQPLRYRREGGNQGFVVYSVGPDDNFDGGQPGGPLRIANQAFFRYPAPAPQPVPANMLK